MPKPGMFCCKLHTKNNTSTACVALEIKNVCLPNPSSPQTHYSSHTPSRPPTVYFPQSTHLYSSPTHPSRQTLYIVHLLPLGHQVLIVHLLPLVHQNHLFKKNQGINVLQRFLKSRQCLCLGLLIITSLGCSNNTQGQMYTLQYHPLFYDWKNI